MKRVIRYSLLMLACMYACTPPKAESAKQDFEEIENPNYKVVASSEIIWEKLNPARGDKSPQAGTVWGDRKGTVATGFLAKFVDGFSSPPHIHNVTYRAVVISGWVHNDDPQADYMWMPPGSFWTQPAGEPHITAAKGNENIAYVEIDSGPYLVKPTTEAFDNGERPVNIDKRNIVWLDASQTRVIDEQEGTPSLKIAFLWENEDMAGNFIKIPSGIKAEIVSEGELFYAVVIAGEPSCEMPKTKEIKSLDPGSYMSSNGRAIHRISSNKGKESIIYVRTNGAIRMRQLGGSESANSPFGSKD